MLEAAVKFKVPQDRIGYVKVIMKPRYVGKSSHSFFKKLSLLFKYMPDFHFGGGKQIGFRYFSLVLLSCMLIFLIEYFMFKYLFANHINTFGWLAILLIPLWFFGSYVWMMTRFFKSKVKMNES